MSRTAILMGRLHKLENYQSKMLNLSQGRVFGGELPPEAKAYFTGEVFNKKAKDRIAKAERLKLEIALQVYDDVTA